MDKDPSKSDISKAKLTDFPFYEPNKPPQYWKYHSEVSYLDELEKIWGKRWGAQGIGRIREVVVTRPDDIENDPIFSQDDAYFFSRSGPAPSIKLMQKQHDNVVSFLEREGIKVHYMKYPKGARSAYGPMQHSISAAACFVINGGAIIPREGAPYWRGRGRYVAEFLMSIGCPILYTIHGKGVCEIGAFTRMADDFLIGMLSTDCNQEGLEQVKPILERSGYKEILVARSPGSLNYSHPDATGWRHSDIWIAPVDVDLALVYPPYCDYETIRRLKELGYKLIEVPEEEHLRCLPCNAVTLAPRRMMMNKGAPKTLKALEKEGVEVMEIPFDEIMKYQYGGGLRCKIGTLIRDPGPKLFK